MEHKQDVLVASDGLKLHNEAYIPKRIKAVLVITHGYAEHAGRYQDFATYLANNDIAVYALDDRGHGKSGGEKANVKVFREYVDDLKRFIEYVREKQPNLPRFLLGHSMGGLVASQCMLEHPHLVDGLLLSSAFLRNATKVPPALMAISGVVSRILPGLPTIKLDASLVSRDKAVVDAYINDPLVYTGGTKARLGAEMLATGNYVLSRTNSIALPILVMYGTADRIADPKGSQLLFETVASKDKTLKSYDGFYHEILNEIGKEQVYKDILTWLNAHITA